MGIQSTVSLIMARVQIIGLLLAITGNFVVHSLTTTIKQRVVAGKKKFQCTFVLKHFSTEVNVKGSKLACSPKKPMIKSLNVELESADYFFSGNIKINPSDIVSMDVSSLTTAIAPNQTSGPKEVEFKELYKNASSEIKPEYRHHCGIDPIEDNMRRMDTSYTSMSAEEIWANGVIPWSFVSTGDDFAKFAVHTDENVGLTKDDVETVMAAMKQIEDKTCIMFNRVKPVKGQPWLFIFRDNKISDMSCQIPYIKSDLVGKDTKGLGDIYSMMQWAPDDFCFSGAYAGYGSRSPQNLVISKAILKKDDQRSIGLIVHELLHNLGIGHTQKRQDASENIEINWGNIEPSSQRQYEACIEANGCTRYNHYDTEYDCMSIMHYRDYFPLTSEARSARNKTMVAKKEGCNLSSSVNTLTPTDIEILKKMYCANKPGGNQKVVMSTNFPSNYPDNEDKVYPITVDEGHVISLVFTDFTIEAQDTCSFDWVGVVDADWSVLIDKTCGVTKPNKITSKFNNITIIFHSDSSITEKGFRAEYEAVTSAPTPVNGGWGEWSEFSTCSNKKDDKSVCKKKKVRYCNKPAALHGGNDCAGESEMFEVCVLASTDSSKNPECVLHGGWTAWSSASVCSASCASTRTRSCTNPVPVNSKECDGAESESSDCTGGDCQASKNGTIKSPNYPNDYPPNEDITIPLNVRAGATIHLAFESFELEGPVGFVCLNDFVKVMDSDGTTELAKLCGEYDHSLNIRSSGNKLTVVFQSDNNVNKKGFEATWTEFAVVEAGEVTSPGYPGSYPNSETMSKTIFVAEGAKIELTFTAMSIEPLGGDSGLDGLDGSGLDGLDGSG